MKCIWVFILILLVSIQAPEVMAAPSLLGMCHKDWNCDATVKLYNGQESIVTGWLENTFGSSCSCADRLLQDPRKKIVRVHLINSPCMRNKRCGRYEVLYKETAASASRKVLRNDRRFMAKFNRVVETTKKRLEQATGELECYVSPCLECDLYEKPRRILADIVSAALPMCRLVDSPHRRRCLKGTTCELHGESPSLAQPCIVDLDGVDGATINVRSYAERYRHCDLQFYWQPWMNCINGEFIDPRKRRCSYSSAVFRNVRGVLCQYFYPWSDIC